MLRVASVACALCAAQSATEPLHHKVEGDGLGNIARVSGKSSYAMVFASQTGLAFRGKTDGSI